MEAEGAGPRRQQNASDGYPKGYLLEDTKRVAIPRLAQGGRGG